MSQNNRRNSNRRGKNYEEDQTKDVKSRSSSARDNTSSKSNRGKKVVSDKEVKERRLDNDINWYFTDKALLDEATYFSFNQFLGTPIRDRGYEVPSIMALHLNPCPGVTVMGKRAGINMAGYKLYTMLSMKSGRTMNYAPQDVITLMLALGEVISWTEFARRAFGIAFAYSQRNRAYPTRVLQAMGLDADDFFKNMGVYRPRINTVINQINKIPFPVNIAYLDKCSALYKKVYVDSESPMAQTYLMIPSTTWILDEQAFEGGTILRTVDGPVKAQTAGAGTGFSKFDYIIDTLDSMIKALLESTTLNYIYSDILNFASLNKVPLFGVELIDPGYSIVPEFNLGVLEQIHNGIWYGDPVIDTAAAGLSGYTDDNNVYPDPDNNCIIYNPTFKVDQVSHPRFFVDFYDGSPDVVRRAETTRYIMSYRDVVSGTSGYYSDVVTLPDHYITHAVVYRSNSWVDVLHPHWNAGTDTVDGFASIDALTSFDYSPIIPITDQNGSGLYGILGDLNYYTELDYEYLSRTNDLIAMALFELR